jgi:hypothetical protein
VVHEQHDGHAKSRLNPGKFTGAEGGDRHGFIHRNDAIPGATAAGLTPGEKPLAGRAETF